MKWQQSRVYSNVWYLFILIFIFSISCFGGGGGSSSGDSTTSGYGDIVGGVTLENLTTSASFESSTSLTAKRTNPNQAYVTVSGTKSQYLSGKPAILFLTDTSVSGEATLYDFNDEPVATTDIVNGEYQFSDIANDTYKLVLTLATPADFAGMSLTTFVDVTANSTITPRPSPLSEISVAAATYMGNQFGIKGDLWGEAGLADMIEAVQNCYESSGDVGVEDEIQVSDLKDSSGNKLSLESLKAQFDSIPSACKNLGDTSFAKFRLLAAGDDPVQITQAMCEILHKSGFVLSLNDPEFSFCHPNYQGGGSPFTADQITENYCPNPEGDCTNENGETWSYSYAVLPDLVESDRNRSDEEPNYWLPTLDEYRIISMAVAHSKGITVTPKEIYQAMVDSDALGLRLCFDTGRGGQYCLDPDGVPILNQDWNNGENEPRLSSEETQEPSCHEILPIFCNEGESIDSFAEKNINMDKVKESIIFKRVHVPWNNTGGPNEWVVFDGDAWRKDSTAQPVKVNIVRDADYGITNMVQAVDGGYFLGSTENTEKEGEVRLISVDSGLEMQDDDGRFQRWNLSDISYLSGVQVRESGSHVFGGPSVEINEWSYGVIYDGWQTGAAPIEVCVTYTDHYTVAQNEDGTCDGSTYYLAWTEGTEKDNVANLIDVSSGDCALEDPEERQSESNECVRWSFSKIFGLQEFEYRDNYTHVFAGDVANPRYKVDRDPYFDDFPLDPCDPDAGGEDGIWCSETLYSNALCDDVEPTFSWRSYLANPDAPYSVDNNFYRWSAAKDYAWWDGKVLTYESIECGEVFDWQKQPPHPGDQTNVLKSGQKGDSFDYMATPAENGLTSRNFKARYNAYAVGRPNSALNMAALAFGDKFVLTPDTPFKIIDAFALIYLSWEGVETNVVVPEITIADWGYDPETQQQVDATFYDEIFHAQFYMPRRDNYDDFQTIMKKFGIPREVYEESDIWNNFDHEDEDNSNGDEDFGNEGDEEFH